MNAQKLFLPLTTVCILLVSLFSGYLYLESKFDEAGSERQQIRDKIVANSNSDRREFDRLENELVRVGRDRIHRSQIELWTERLGRQNPSIVVPPLPESE